MKLPFNLRLPELLRLTRPKQWVKNGFVLAPLVFAREFNDAGAVANALIAFALFCVASSATYILNDLRDIERDRSHPVKRSPRVAPEKAPESTPIKLMPTCAELRNFPGSSPRRSATAAPLLPSAAMTLRRAGREETTASSDMESKPLHSTRTRTMRSSTIISRC